jgi:hypothetical protein
VFLGAYILLGEKCQRYFNYQFGFPIFPSVSIFLTYVCVPVLTRLFAFFFFLDFPHFTPSIDFLSLFYNFPFLHFFQYRVFVFPVFPAPLKGLCSTIFLHSS